MTTKIYGIKTCDTVRKARTWLDAHGIAYQFHDYRASGIDEARLRRWVAALGWTKLLNNAGTSFRALPEADKAGLADAAQAEALAIALMLANPTLIKRPVIETGEALHVGFKPGDYAALFG
ncbi:MAG: ArsC family reductase [Sphingomonas sp.]|uniref:ArsC family reductase n=1 Tax=Sphingomonas sp. TaxID=28214 RepID=UPI000DB16C7A|nr:ArsC family reductase [Zymomonas sp.]MBA4772340.1 ArsC family reductase [Sphingomonas sp.]PZP11225.1 MAG: ArsC family reductase [Sphingomonas hengshuiensis]